MFLTKGGVTVEVFHPSDIERYKKLGYVKELSPEEKNAAAIQAVNDSKGTPTTELQSETKEPKASKGKGKTKEGEG